MSQTRARIDPYQRVTDLIIAHLERGTVPWRCPWQRQTGRPRNFQTGHAYRGVNVLLLGLQHFASPWWMTFRQAKERGGSIRKGEHGSFVVKFGKYEKAAAEADGEGEKKVKLYLKSYVVFNGSQIEGVEFPESAATPKLAPEQRIAHAEEIVAGMPKRPPIREGKSDRACYRHATDLVDMPAFASFTTPESYYLTLYHELVHYAAIRIMPRRCVRL